MSQSQPDRLDRIEATLEQVVQALNNQATINTELRSSIESIVNNQVTVNAELRSSVNSLINIANQHQENFMVVVNEIRDIRADMRVMLQRVENLENRQ
jgi:type II secretory pathway predicted ATPase ExeA